MPQLPMVMIEETNADPELVTKTLDLVATEAEETLRRLQENAQVPPDQMVAPFVVSPPSTPEAGMPSRTRSTVALFVGGLGLSILFTVVLDLLFTRFAFWRRTRRDSLESRAVDDKPVAAPIGTDNHHPDRAVTSVDGARPVG